MAANSQLPIPHYDWEAKDQLRELRLFRKQLESYFKLKKTKVEDRLDLVKLLLGKEGFAAHDRWQAPEEEKEDVDEFLTFLSTKFDNEISQRVRVYDLEDIRKTPDETVEELVDRIRQLAQLANIGDGSDAAIEFEVQRRLIRAIPDSDIELRKEMLKLDKTKGVNDLLDIARTYYAVEAGAKHLNKSTEIDAVRTYNRKGFKPKQHSGTFDCGNCTKQHEPGKCPARNSTCSYCKNRGHWVKRCRKLRNKEQQAKSSPLPSQPTQYKRGQKKGPQRMRQHDLEMDEEEYDEDPNIDELHIGSVHVGDDIGPEPREITINAMARLPQRRRHEVFTKITLPTSEGTNKRADLTSKADTGSGGNTLPKRLFAKLYPQQLDSYGNPTGLLPTTTRLTAYNGGKVPCFGAINLRTEWKPRSGPPRYTNTLWYVVDSEGPALIGLPTCERLGIVTINCDALQAPRTSPAEPTSITPIQSTEDLIRQYPDRFEGLGRFPGQYTIHLKEGAEPKIHPPRKCPIAVKHKVKAELDKMVTMGVIVKMNEPTNWVNSLAYAQKPNGDIRICLDPRDLNKWIRRDHHRTPTVEEVSHKFAGSKFFTKLDAKTGYWSIALDEESSKLTTFNSPYGRYRFLRLPFGLACSQDIFQRRMDQILENCPGCTHIADDITIHGATEEEHDQNLHNLMMVARQNGLILNPAKTEVKAKSITFFGSCYDENGVHPDPAKVADIKQWAPPDSIQKLQEFLGMVTYLSPFIPGLSTLTAPLRELLRKDADFQWDATYDQAFQKIKDAISADTTLRHFDTNEHVTIQVDASQEGLGAALLQNGKPVAFASKALTETERRYANIERELLAVVFGVERFHTYVFGRYFTIESDHKPLEAITTKTLAQTPPRLQRMLLRLQGYNFTLVYKPGKELLLADALSRYSPQPCGPIKLELSIHTTTLTDDVKSDFQHEIATNPEMKALVDLIICGWPDDIKGVPKALRPYWPHRDCLSLEDGLIFKGETLVIPPGQRQRTLESLHKSHQGITKTTLLAKNHMFWPGYTKAIEETVKKCETCMTHQAKNAPTPLQPTPPPARPWQIVASDIFTLDGTDYLIVGDFYSKMHLVRRYPKGQTTAAKTIGFMKEIFSEHGVPELLRTDNGPQYSADNFAVFCETWQIKHQTSSPGFPQSNGFAEAMVKIVKGTLQRAKESGTDPYLALLDTRSTPIDSKLNSPAELLYQRPLRTTIPGNIKNTDPTSQEIRDHQEEKINKMKDYHDKKARTLAGLYVGQNIAWYDRRRELWLPAVIIKCLDNDDYLIKTPMGAIYRKTRQHLKERFVATKDPVELRPKPQWKLQKFNPNTITQSQNQAAPPAKESPQTLRVSQRTTKGLPPIRLIQQDHVGNDNISGRG